MAPQTETTKEQPTAQPMAQSWVSTKDLSLAGSLVQTMEPTMVHCWERNLAVSSVAPNAPMMEPTKEPDLVLPMDQSWVATMAKSLVQTMAPQTVHCWAESWAES